MTLSTYPHWLGIAIPMSVLAIVGYAAWHFRLQRSKLFRDNECDKTAVQAIRDIALRDVNEKCPGYSFEAERVSNVTVRGQPVALAYGNVWWEDSRAHSLRCVYAVAPRDQSQWMRQQSDLFEHVCDGTAFSIFWVKLAPLIRLTK
jgi:hypothetical protein